MRNDYLKNHMKQHEKDKFEKESLCSSSIHSSTTSLQEDTESEFSVDTSNKTYEVISTLESEEMTKRLIKDDQEYKYKVERGKKIYEKVGKYGIKKKVCVQNIRKCLICIQNKEKTLILIMSF